MAKTEYIDILPSDEQAFYSSLQSGDRFTYSRIRKKVTNYSKKKKAGLNQRSLLPQIAAIGNSFSDGEKLAWSEAGAESNLNGGRLFVQDQCARFYNDLPGSATPSLLHQSWIGNIHIEAPADEAKIIQLHPHFYGVSQKVSGKKGMYQPVLVTEDVSLPFSISLNYSSDLTPVSETYFATLYARFRYSYQGVDRYFDLSVPLDLTTDGKNASASLTNLPSYIIGYELYLWIKGLTGDVYFDNIKVTHSGQNWARDPFCKDILQTFTRAFYQVPKHGAAITLPEGAIYDSIYKDF